MLRCNTCTTLERNDCDIYIYIDISLITESKCGTDPASCCCLTWASNVKRWSLDDSNAAWTRLLGIHWLRSLADPNVKLKNWIHLRIHSKSFKPLIWYTDIECKLSKLSGQIQWKRRSVEHYKTISNWDMSDMSLYISILKFHLASASDRILAFGTFAGQNSSSSTSNIKQIKLREV